MTRQWVEDSDVRRSWVDVSAAALELWLCWKSADLRDDRVVEVRAALDRVVD